MFDAISHMQFVKLTKQIACINYWVLPLANKNKLFCKPSVKYSTTRIVANQIYISALLIRLGGGNQSVRFDVIILA